MGAEETKTMADKAKTGKKASAPFKLTIGRLVGKKYEFKKGIETDLASGVLSLVKSALANKQTKEVIISVR